MPADAYLGLRLRGDDDGVALAANKSVIPAQAGT
jgi:hypothetical protein